MKNFIFAIIFVIHSSAFALNYHSLEVYNYQIEGPGVIELENTTSISSGTKAADIGLARSSFEAVYGISDKWEGAIYLDLSKVENDEWDYAGFRARARTQFADKGEYAIDTGVYFEVEVPDGGDEVFAFENRWILEKDFGRFTYVLNPIIELEVEDEKLANGESEREMEVEFKYSTGLNYRTSPHFLPHVQVIGDISNDEHVALIGGDYSFPGSVELGLSIGHGLNEKSERALAVAKIEYEF